jgi:hypothetical protein
VARPHGVGATLERDVSPRAARKLWRAIRSDMDEYEAGPEKFAQLVHDAGDSLIRMDEVIKAMTGKVVKQLLDPVSGD